MKGRAGTKSFPGLYQVRAGVKEFLKAETIHHKYKIL
jgi:hypothetical protein